MTWHKSTLRIPQNLTPVNCSTVAAHPWAFGVGQAEKSGSFLSPLKTINDFTVYIRSPVAHLTQLMSMLLFMEVNNVSGYRF
ncbi:phage-like protein [Yersinia frederiksenii]|nr:phage-like protein [Yersinia frederiksenii]